MINVCGVNPETVFTIIEVLTYYFWIHTLSPIQVPDFLTEWGGFTGKEMDLQILPLPRWNTGRKPQRVSGLTG